MASAGDTLTQDSQAGMVLLDPISTQLIVFSKSSRKIF